MAKALLKDLVPKNKAAIAAGAAGVAAMQPEDSEAVILRAATPTVRAAPKYAYKATEENMQMALDMFDEGIDPKEIYAETGFFKGADGILRFEVSDKGVVYKVATDKQALMDERGVEPRRFSTAVDHPATKPGGKQSVVTFAPAKSVEEAGGAQYDPVVMELDLSDQAAAGYATGDTIVLDRNYTMPELRQSQLDNSRFPEATQRTLDRLTPENIVMHEQQHIIQDAMGLAPGGNQGYREQLFGQREGNKALIGIPDELRQKSLEYDRRMLDLGQMSDFALIEKYRDYGKEGLSQNSNLTGKRRLLVGNSSWYKYGDKIRQKLGPEPKRHRPKREREEWLSSAWIELANFMEEDVADNVIVAKANAYVRVRPEEARKLQSLKERADAFDQERISGFITKKDLEKALRKVQREVTPLLEAKKEYMQRQGRISQLQQMSDYEAYESLAGEVEARNVEKRLGMSQEELYASYPKSTEDVPRERQILRKNPMEQPFLYGTGAAVAGAGMLPKESQAAFAEKRDQKNTAWTQLKDAVGGLDPSFKQLSQLLSETAKTNPMLSGQREIGGFLANSLAGMGSGFMGAAAYNEPDPSAMDYFSAEQIEGARDFVRGAPEAIGFGSMEDNLINQALMDAMSSVAETVTDNDYYRAINTAFIEPALQDVGPDVLDWYESLDPRTQGQLGGVMEYLSNAIR